MRRFIVFAAITAAVVASAEARSLNVKEDGVTYSFSAAGMGDATVSNGRDITVQGRTFAASAISEMYVSETDVTPTTVTVTYAESGAEVTVAGDLAAYVSATVSGGHVTVTQSAEVSDATCGEITYTLSGESANGSFTLSGSYKASIDLNGVSLTNPGGAAIYIDNGKRIAVSVKAGTENSLTDGSASTQKGALACRGHLELKGKGVLNVSGNAAHAIFAKEYVELKNCTVNVLAAAKDGINCTQYFSMESGELNIKGVADDGVQVDFKDTENREADDTGSVTISGGTIVANITGIAAQGIKTEGDLAITGGNIAVTTSGRGQWDSTKSKTKASAALKSDADITIGGGTLKLTASGSGGKGTKCDGRFTMNGGTVTVSTTGGLFAYSGGKEYDGYTGSADRLSSNYKSSPKGIKADTEVTINGGTLNVTTTGNGGEGIESKGILTINDGSVTVHAYDDAINSASHSYYKGGEVVAGSTSNDGLDSNGNMYISGGKIIAYGAGAPECGIDANEEGGYSVIFTGGTLLAMGGGNSVPSTSTSTQAYVSGSLTVSAGATVTIKSGSTELASFTVPANYSSNSRPAPPSRFMAPPMPLNAPGGWGPGGGGPGGGGPGGGGPGGGGPGGSSSGGGMLITCPGLTSGSSYTVSCGSSSTTLTATLRGSSSGGRW